MLRHFRSALIALVIAMPAAVSAAPIPPPREVDGESDLIGSFDACGPLERYTPSTPTVPGSFRVFGVDTVNGESAPYRFHLAPDAVVDAVTDATLTQLASARDFTCLAITTDASGLVTTVAVDDVYAACGWVFLIDGVILFRDLADYALFDTLHIAFVDDARALLGADPVLGALLVNPPEGGFTATDVCVTFTIGVDGRLIGIAVSGWLAFCAGDAIVDNLPNPASPSLIFDYVGGVPVPQATVQIGPLVLDTALFTLPELGFLELGYWAVEGSFGNPENPCTGIVVTAEGGVVTDVRMLGSLGEVCGVREIHGWTQPGMTFGLTPAGATEPFALIHDTVAGYSYDWDGEEAGLANLLHLLHWARATGGTVCIGAGSTASVPLGVQGFGSFCVVIRELTATEIVIDSAPEPTDEYFFRLRLRPESYVTPGIALDTEITVGIAALPGIDGGATVVSQRDGCEALPPPAPVPAPLAELPAEVPAPPAEVPAPADHDGDRLLPNTAIVVGAPTDASSLNWRPTELDRRPPSLDSGWRDSRGL